MTDSRLLTTEITAFGIDFRHRVSAAAAFVSLAAAVVLLPVLAIPTLIVIILATHRRAPQLVGPVVVAMLAAILAWINAGKEIAGDWTWYVTHYRILEYTPLDGYLGTRIGWIIPDKTEPLYYSIASILSVASNANVAVLAVVVTSITYGGMGTAIAIAVASTTRRPALIAIATVAGMLMGLTFTLTTQLVRQEMAAAFVAVGLVLLSRRRIILSATFILAAVLTHNSAIIPAAGVAVAFILGASRRLRLLKWIAIGTLFYGLGRYYLASSGDAVYSTQNDGSISPVIIVLDASVAIVFALLVARTMVGQSKVASFVLMCVPSFYGFVLGVASQPLPLLRMYFYIEVLRALMIAVTCVWLMRSKFGVLFGLGLVAIAVAYAQLRINQSPFVYDLSLVPALFWSPLFTG